MAQFPGLASQMNPTVATESMMQLANVFAGRMDERKKWGYHLPSSWELFFATAAKDCDRSLTRSSSRTSARTT